MQKTIVLIPSLNPNTALITLIRGLKRAGFEYILLVNDGSGAEYRAVFQEAERLGCDLAVHVKNRGKGAALKTGMRLAIERYGEKNRYITADADGQHLPEDIRKVADALTQHPDSLILGTRNFNSGDVPWKSRCGNRITSVFFRLTSGIRCSDTQTGLRGIPSCLESLALSEDGERYEYEMNFLSDAARRVSFLFVPIQTVYMNENQGSHFRPVADAALVYGRFLRCITASLAGAGIDLILFPLFSHLLPLAQAQTIFLATMLARLCSGSANYLFNRLWSFHSKMPVGGEVARYGALFTGQMCLSAALVALLSALSLAEMLAKILVDTCLFFISFVIQKNWVFRKGSAQ